MQEMTITSVHALGPRYAVILKEKDADRYLPILVGASDANAIAIKLHNPQVSLNLTHDLLCTVIDALGGSVRQVLINALQDDILYSKITIQTSDSSHDIDCRPGDALALAVWTHVAISGSTVTLTLASAVTSTDEVTISYTVPSDAAAARLKDLSDNPAASFAAQAVTNNSAAALTPLTASIHSEPASHDAQAEFTFELRFSENLEGLSYRTLRDHAFTVTGGEVQGARRLVSGSNIRWTITVRPDGDGTVAIVLPITTDCTALGAVCTGDGRRLSNRLELTVGGPGQ